MRLALLSNVTVDFLADELRKKFEVYVPAGFNVWEREALDASSALYGAGPDAVVLLLHAGALEFDGREDLLPRLDEIASRVRLIAQRLPSVPVFVSSLDFRPTLRWAGGQSLESEAERRFIERIEEERKDFNNAYLLPVKEIVTDIGRNDFYSSKMWYLASMPYSMKGISALSSLVYRYVSPVESPRKKCLAVDLDNTLWGGVVGEDGVDALVLSSSKEGARYRDAQKVLKKMKEQGVLLAILSKNNPEDAERAFLHPGMVLKREDFAAERIDWKPKTENIRSLAAELNIGLDSFVFLDVNPAEREEMRSLCPEVEVADFPKDTSRLPEVITDIYNKYFLSLRFTAEDAGKTEMYRARAERKTAMENADSLSDYLKKLEMRLSVHLMDGTERTRVVQLIGKTNQFNLTTKRYSEEEVRSIESRGDVDIVTVRLADRYGDEGLIAVLIIRYEEAGGSQKAVVDTFLMSCRVMGREVEREVFACLKDLFMQRGAETVEAEYVRTPKNSPVETLYERLGFEVVTTSPERKIYRIKTERLENGTDLFESVHHEWGQRDEN